jgi:hypothetical protein
MKTQLKKYAAVAIISATAAFAQEAPVEQGAVETPVATETPAAAEQPAAEPAPIPVPVPVPVAEVPAPEPVAVAAVESVAPAAPKEPMNIKFHLGLRPAIGISAFRGHKSFDFGEWKAKTQPALSFGLGVATAFEFNSLISLAPELQYTMYRANKEFVEKETNADFYDLNEVGIKLHALELPILCRFNLNDFYAEIGPQVGYNIKSVIYKNASLKEPRLNAFAFGGSIGGGMNLNSSLIVGIRSYIALLEYAERSNGYPWTVQVGITQFLF